MDFLGNSVCVIKSNRKTVSLEIKSDGITVKAPAYMSESRIRAFLESKSSWIEKHLTLVSERNRFIESLPVLTQAQVDELIAEAKKIIPKRVEYYAPKIGVDYSKITVRCQRTRWGSCSSKGNLSFNCLIVLFPSEVLDSIVVHELCHRKYMNHSDLFYKEIEKVFPNYKKCERWLKEQTPNTVSLNGKMYAVR